MTAREMRDEIPPTTPGPPFKPRQLSLKPLVIQEFNRSICNHREEIQIEFACGHVRRFDVDPMLLERFQNISNRIFIRAHARDLERFQNVGELGDNALWLKRWAPLAEDVRMILRPLSL